MKYVYLKTKVPVQGKDNELCGPCDYADGSPVCFCFKEGGERRELVAGSTPHSVTKYKRTKTCLKAEVKEKKQ